MTIGSLAVLVLLCTLEWSAAWPQMISSDSVCEQFHVAHVGVEWRNINSTAITVSLTDNSGTEVDCIVPRTSYTLVVHSTKEGREIKGFLLKLNASNQGSFPTTHPDNVAVGVCKEPSVSHRCPRTYGCSFGETLTFGYTSPSKPKSDVIFRYAIVTSHKEYVQNEHRVFPVCPPANARTSPPPVTDTITTTPPPPDCQTNRNQQEAHDNNLTQDNQSIRTCSNFTLKIGTDKVKDKKSGHCGRDSYDSNETHIHTDPNTNINYTCFTSKTIRITDCTPTCPSNDKSGEQWCCRISAVRYRSRDFQCKANLYLNSGNIPEHLLTKVDSFKRRQTKGCECYPCSKIDCMSDNDSRCPPATQDVDVVTRV